MTKYVFILLSLLPSCTSDHGEQHDAGILHDSPLDAGPDDAPVSVTLAPPEIVSVKPMHGGLHLLWENKETGCDAIEGERKSTADFKVLFTIPDGSVDNKHDAMVVPGETYTYRVRCKKNGAFSGYSNEVSATP